MSFKLKLASFIAVLVGAMVAPLQGAAQGQDAGQISALMTALSDQSRPPSALLDPNLGSSERAKNLSRFGTSSYTLTLRPTEAIPSIGGTAISVAVRVHYSRGEGNYLDAEATAHFVKRNGEWYFADYDFLAIPTFLVFVMVGGALIGIAYAVVVLILLRRLLNQKQIGLSAAKAFIPFFWPSLFRQDMPKVTTKN